MADVAYDDEGQAGNRVKFVSQERRLVPRPPFYRPPIYFPTLSLQMLRLGEAQRAEVKATGWTREVAFRTSPEVTKLEIKGILEGLYGMSVERVHTINYLGRKHVTFSGGRRPSRRLWREADWKKAYVIFRPPPPPPPEVPDGGQDPPPNMAPEGGDPKSGGGGGGAGGDMLRELLVAKGVITREKE